MDIFKSVHHMNVIVQCAMFETGFFNNNVLRFTQVDVYVRSLFLFIVE